MLKNITYRFAKYEIPIILLKDFVKLGQRGEIVMMKPKKARLHFLKKSIGVPDFPGRWSLIFPDFDEQKL